jgi:RNA polymerase sigma-70 factor (ECF subfamily)
VRSPALKSQPHLRVVAGGADSRAPTYSDAELIDAFEQGDLEMSGHLYDRLERVVHGTLIKVLGERGQDHDDLVQTAFEQILLTLARKKFARACSLASWAVSVTTHVALNAIRKRQAERRNLKDDPEALEATEVAADRRVGAERSAMMLALRTELAKMPPVTADVVVLHEVMGHDLAEVATLTGLSVAAAQSRLVRGRAELRRRLESQFPGAGR